MSPPISGFQLSTLFQSRVRALRAVRSDFVLGGAFKKPEDSEA